MRSNHVEENHFFSAHVTGPLRVFLPPMRRSARMRFWTAVKSQVSPRCFPEKYQTILPVSGLTAMIELKKQVVAALRPCAPPRSRGPPLPVPDRKECRRSHHRPCRPRVPPPPPRFPPIRRSQVFVAIFQFRMFEKTFRRIAGHRVEAPHLFAGIPRRTPQRTRARHYRPRSIPQLPCPLRSERARVRKVFSVTLLRHNPGLPVFLVRGATSVPSQHSCVKIRPLYIATHPRLGGSTTDALALRCAESRGPSAIFNCPVRALMAKHHVPAQDAIHHSRSKSSMGAFNAGTTRLPVFS